MLGGIGAGPNLGEPRFVDYGLVPGDQYFTIAGSGGGCTGDLDGSGDVGFPDILAILAAWGPCSGCDEDLDASGDVGFPDLLTVLSAYGPCP